MDIEVSLSKLTDPPEGLISIRESFELLHKSFDELEKALRSYKECTVVGVNCTSPYFRRTKPDPPIEVPKFDSFLKQNDGRISLLKEQHSNTPPYFPTVEVLVTLERSREWSSDLSVINKLKIKFYLEMAKFLHEQHRWEIIPQESMLYAMIDPIVFEVKVVHLNEMRTLNAQEKSGTVKTKSLTPSDLFMKQFVLTPLLARQLEGMSRRFYIFAESCQFVKKWLAFNYLSDVFDEIAIELMVAHVFINSGEFVPKTIWSAFFRFLSFLSTHDFVEEPIIVDMNNLFAAEQLEQAKKEFLKKRPALPPLILIIPEDTLGTMFTCLSPEAILLKRAVSLATLAREILVGILKRQGMPTFEDLIVHNLSVFDLKIRIQGRQLAIREPKNDQKQKMNLEKRKRQKSAESTFPVVNYNPVQKFITDLRENYGANAIFFSNEFKSYLIGVIFRPTFLADRDSKVATGSELRLLDPTNGVLRANIGEFVENIKIMGNRLVRDVMPSDQLAQHFATDFRQESVAGNDAHKKKGHKIGQSKARTNKPKNGKNMAKKWKKGKNITS